MLRFRTHRSLFKHLHVCSDSASSPAPPPKTDKPVLPATSAPEKDPPAKPPEGLPKLPGVIRPPEKEAILPGADTAPAAPAVLPTGLPELPGSLEALPLVSQAPHPFPLLEPSLFGPSSLTQFSGPPHSSVPGPFLSYVPPSPYSLSQPPAQHRLRPYVPGHGPPVSNAVWKKSQGERKGPFGQTFFCSRLDQQLPGGGPAVGQPRIPLVPAPCEGLPGPPPSSPPQPHPTSAPPHPPSCIPPAGMLD